MGAERCAAAVDAAERVFRDAAAGFAAFGALLDARLVGLAGPVVAEAAVAAPERLLPDAEAVGLADVDAVLAAADVDAVALAADVEDDVAAEVVDVGFESQADGMGFALLLTVGIICRTSASGSLISVEMK